jgi:hypothetical protein
MKTKAILRQKNERQMRHARPFWGGHEEHAKPYILRKDPQRIAILPSECSIWMHI